MQLNIATNIYTSYKTNTPIKQIDLCLITKFISINKSSTITKLTSYHMKLMQQQTIQKKPP